MLSATEEVFDSVPIDFYKHEHGAATADDACGYCLANYTGNHRRGHGVSG